MSDPIKEMYEKQKELEASGHEVYVTPFKDKIAYLMEIWADHQQADGFSVSEHREEGGKTAYMMTWRKTFGKAAEESEQEKGEVRG